jgi:aspartyl/asparaginyl beta-hydroxylase (cupin superfamily)
MSATRIMAPFKRRRSAALPRFRLGAVDEALEPVENACIRERRRLRTAPPVSLKNAWFAFGNVTISYSGAAAWSAA